MEHNETLAPDSSAVRVALWRAMHLQVDQPPYVFEDDLGLKLAAPQDDWRTRPDMDPRTTSTMRASIVARARYVEDFVKEQTDHGIKQYVILGAGLDTFAQRKPEIASRLKIFEIDRPGAQAWKRQRLMELGFDIPEWLRFVPVDFESGESWWKGIISAGFNPQRPTIITAIGLSMYLTIETIAEMMRQIAALPSGSTLLMSYLLTVDLVGPEERRLREWAEKGARQSGTPFTIYFTPSQIIEMARQAGFKKAENISGTNFAELYFKNRTDGLHPAMSEEILVASI
jgi:methyltransferase (TIGR00027 family)